VGRLLVQSDSNPRECYEDERDTDNTDDITDYAVFETFEILDHNRYSLIHSFISWMVSMSSKDWYLSSVKVVSRSRSLALICVRSALPQGLQMLLDIVLVC
jgi:hypothetical protein